jgi:ADP-ribose pyrophosphatase
LAGRTKSRFSASATESERSMKIPPDESAAAPEPWERISSQVSHEYSVFRTRHERTLSPTDGSEHGFDLIDSPEAVTVIAFDEAGDLVMVEQFRHGTRDVVLEFPGGIRDPGEAPVASGTRELREETGYEAGTAEYLGLITLNPAWQNTSIHLVRVWNARRVGEKDLDEAEDTCVRLVSVEELLARARSGRFNSSVAVAALALHLWSDSQSGPEPESGG